MHVYSTCKIDGDIKEKKFKIRVIMNPYDEGRTWKRPVCWIKGHAFMNWGSPRFKVCLRCKKDNSKELQKFDRELSKWLKKAFEEHEKKRKNKN